MARQPRTFYYHCPHCGRRQNVNCKFCGKTYIFDPTKRPDEKWVIKKVRFGELQWQRLVARAKVTPAVEGPAELIRLMCDECLAMPPVRLISS
jgi:phage terminase large subunit GpA-like protein